MFYADNLQLIKSPKDLSIPICYAGAAKVTPLQAEDIPEGYSLNTIFDPAALNECPAVLNQQKVMIPCSWERQPTRYYKVRFVLPSGLTGTGIAEVFPTSVTDQYVHAQ